MSIEPKAVELDFKAVQFNNTLRAVDMNAINLVVTATKTLVHGDIKSQAASGKWREMKKGQSGVIEKIFENFYGTYCTVRLADGSSLDVEAQTL